MLLQENELRDSAQSSEPSRVQLPLGNQVCFTVEIQEWNLKGHIDPNTMQEGEVY